MATKIIGVCASPRKNGSTRYLLENCVQEIHERATSKGSVIETEIIDLAGMKFGGCVACDKCKHGTECSRADDFREVIPAFLDPELAGIILATPVYMGTMTSQAKAFIDRTVLFRRNGFLFRNIIGAVITVGGSRNGGQELTCQAVHAAMMIHDMIIVGDGGHFGGAAWANHPGGYREDEAGVETAKATGGRVAETVLRMRR